MINPFDSLLFFLHSFLSRKNHLKSYDVLIPKEQSPPCEIMIWARWVVEVEGGAAAERWDVLLERGGKDGLEKKEKKKKSELGVSGRTRSPPHHKKWLQTPRNISPLRLSSSCVSAFKSVPAAAAAARERTKHLASGGFLFGRVLCPTGRTVSRRRRSKRRWILLLVWDCGAFESGAQRSGVGPGALRLTLFLDLFLVVS